MSLRFSPSFQFIQRLFLSHTSADSKQEERLRQYASDQRIESVRLPSYYRGLGGEHMTVHRGQQVHQGSWSRRRTGRRDSSHQEAHQCPSRSYWIGLTWLLPAIAIVASLIVLHLCWQKSRMSYSAAPNSSHPRLRCSGLIQSLYKDLELRIQEATDYPP